jgi:hypothetical protein
VAEKNEAYYKERYPNTDDKTISLLAKSAANRKARDQERKNAEDKAREKYERNKSFRQFVDEKGVKSQLTNESLISLYSKYREQKKSITGPLGK